MLAEKKSAIYEDAISDGSAASLGNIVYEATSEETAFMGKILGHEASESELDDRNFQITLQGALQMSTSEAREIVSNAVTEHANDRNFPHELRSSMISALEGDETEIIEEGIARGFLLRVCASLIRFSSPYPDVRANTCNWDDPEEYCETIRAYVVGIVWVGIGTFVNQFFEVRLPSITLGIVLLQLFSVSMGVFLAKILPDWGINFLGTRYSLNPGPWNYKEQSLVTIMFGITSSLSYADHIILLQKPPLFYDNKWASAGYQICLLLSTQYLGFGISGIFRSLLVYPTQNLWMNNFPTLAFNKAFLTPDDQKPVNGWTLTRWHFFIIVFAAIFIYEWIPIYLMTFLSTFTWMCWIAPKNFNVNAITGSISGLGFNPVPTFDWTSMNYGSPLQTPFFSYCNITAGALVGGLIIAAIYFSNMYYTAYLPINTNILYDNQGLPYDVSKILTGNALDEVKYQAYSPPYFSAANLVQYGAFYAAYTCLYVTSLLYDYEVMWESCKEFVLGAIGKGKSVKDYNDAHSRMMSKYKETPQWWFIIILVVSLALAIVTIKAFPTDTPVWGLFMALGLSVLFLIPIGVLYSRTNNLMLINVLTELLIGYATPGHPVAVMLVKAYGVNTNIQAFFFLNDLKYGHYAKVPPRASFRVQMIATLVSALIVFGVCQFQLTADGICTSAVKETTKFTCPNENTRYTHWFEKYNYVLAASLTAGAAMSAFIIFWSVQYHPKPITWWGTVGFAETYDGEGATLLTLDLDSDPNTHFGPGPGEYFY